MKLRPYQQEAVNAVVEYLCDNPGKNPLCVLGTGLGKSLLMAELIRMCHYEWKSRVVMCTHNADLISQNYDEFLKLEPLAPAGIYSASLGQKQASAPIVFCGIQSIARNPSRLGHVDLLLIDEAHTIGYNDDSMWRKTIDTMLEINPNMRIVGMTATAYRLGTGQLTESKEGGAKAIFDDICYEYGMLDGVKDGYLCEPIPKSMATKIDLSGVHKRGGEYIESELQAAVNQSHITKAVIAEAMAYGVDRSTWMVFCTGVDHCYEMCREIQSHGISCEVVTGETPQWERDEIYTKLKNKELRAVCSVAVMTTGTNIPCIDMIIMVRPTESGGLLVQMTGRGTRPIYAPGFDLSIKEQRLAAIAASQKPNVLMLDFAGNLGRHGPIDMIRGKAKGPGTGITPMKVCEAVIAQGARAGEACNTTLHISVMTCPACGYVFPPPEVEKIETKAANVRVLSTQVIKEIHRVMSVTYREHLGKGGKPNTLRVSYQIGMMDSIEEWICLGHPVGTFPRTKAAQWWTTRSKIEPIPVSAEAAVMPRRIGVASVRPVDMLDTPYAIEAVKEGNFWRVTRYIFSSEGHTEKEQPQVDRVDPRGNPISIADDEIPF